MWQLGLALWLRRRRLDEDVDVVHNLNFHNDWTPSFLWLLGRPLVWGPIGHHPRHSGQPPGPLRQPRPSSKTA